MVANVPEGKVYSCEERALIRLVTCLVPMHQQFSTSTS